jgi:hypothetical protein
MEIVKLDERHISATRPLFEQKKYMGVEAETKSFVQDDKSYADFFHEAFVTTYLSGLKNYHAYGIIDSGIVQAYGAFYESNDEAAWYGNHMRSLGNVSFKPITDKMIEHNEQRGRLKFYTLLPAKSIRYYRRLAFSDYNNERYDSFEEFIVSNRHQCMFSLPWQILFNRALMPIDSVVRCTFLKQKYRKVIFNAGRL